MDNGPLWSQDEHGHYWLLFPNKHALSVSEIREIFSEFGNVKNVTTAGDERGFRFVQYTSVVDVENAIEGLENHPQIKLLPHRPKNKKSQFRQSPEDQNCNGDENVKKNFFQRKPPVKNISESNVPWDKTIAERTLNFDNNSVCSHTSVRNNLEQYASRESLTKCSDTGSASPQTKTHMLLKLRGTNANTFRACSQNSNNQIEDEIPDLVTRDKLKLNNSPHSKKVIYDAEEVIVANIHKDYSSAYILHLFERFEPIAVSYIKAIPETETRYCHVYFKSIQDSVKVESQFDKVYLAGKKLVVLRPCRLMEESIYESTLC